MDQNTEQNMIGMNPQPTEIYSVSFHTKSPMRTHTFWLTDLNMAAEFNKSLLMHPKVTDCHVYAVKANLAAQFIKDPEMGDVSEIEMWERGRGASRRKGSMKEHSKNDHAADAAEGTKT